MKTQKHNKIEEKIQHWVVSGELLVFGTEAPLRTVSCITGRNGVRESYMTKVRGTVTARSAHYGS